MINITPIIEVSKDINKYEGVKKETFKYIEWALRFGANGIFLESDGWGEDLEKVAHFAVEVKEKLAPIWVGIHCVDLDSKTFAEEISPDIDAVWSNVQIGRKNETHPHAQKVNRIFRESFSNTLHFGGVAFDFDHVKTKDLKEVVTLAIPYLDIICTDVWNQDTEYYVEKLRIMSGIVPLAIVGGMTIDNITEFLPYIGWCLPKRCLRTSYSEINKNRIKAFVNKVREWEEQNQG